jgi:hypothetical protein
MYLWLTGSSIDMDKEKGKLKKFPFRIPVKSQDQVEYVKACMDLNPDILNVWVFSADYKELVKMRSWEEWEKLKRYRWDLNTMGRLLELWGDPNKPGEFRPKGGAINSFNDTANYYKSQRTAIQMRNAKVDSSASPVKKQKWKSFKA